MLLQDCMFEQDLLTLQVAARLQQAFAGLSWSEHQRLTQ
jgi:hypothetical protein